MIKKLSLSRRHFVGMAPLAAVAFGACSSSDEKKSSIPSPDYTIPGSGFHGKEENKHDWSVDTRSGKVVFTSHFSVCSSTLASSVYNLELEHSDPEPNFIDRLIRL